MERKGYKDRALQILKANYWPVVGAALLTSVIEAGVNLIPYFGWIIAYFVAPVSMGLLLYIICMSVNSTPTISSIFETAFDGRYYIKRVAGNALATLFLALWSCLFVIPGIIKFYSYACVSYILAAYPEQTTSMDAITISRKLMDGRKLDLFIFDLSFIGWFILSGITCGILSVFFVGPYYMIARTLWIRDVVENSIDVGKFGV